jgi:peptidoglycan/LPS O-acetylase OafA/YrhL
MSTPTQQASRLDYIDSLRGISAMLVVFSHAFVSATHNSLNINLGQVGVFVFFMISGFVIPFSLKQGESPYKRFLLSRFFRLYPAYWFSIVLACGIWFLTGEHQPSLKNLAANATMLQMAIGAPNLIGVYWTLFIELIFYASCVILFSLGILDKPKRMIAVFFALCAASLAVSLARYTMHAKLPVAIPLALCLMYFGCVWRSAVVERDIAAISFLRPMLACLAITAVASCYLSYSWDTSLKEGWLSSSIGYVISLCAFILFTTKIKIRFAIPVFLGAISYSLYLVHHPIIELFQHMSKSMFAAVVWPMMLAAIAAAVMLSIVVYRLIEMPSVRAGKRVQAGAILAPT